MAINAQSRVYAILYLEKMTEKYDNKIAKAFLWCLEYHFFYKLQHKKNINYIVFKKSCFSGPE